MGTGWARCSASSTHRQPRGTAALGLPSLLRELFPGSRFFSLFPEKGQVGAKVLKMCASENAFILPGQLMGCLAGSEFKRQVWRCLRGPLLLPASLPSGPRGAPLLHTPSCAAEAPAPAAVASTGLSISYCSCPSVLLLHDYVRFTHCTFHSALPPALCPVPSCTALPAPWECKSSHLSDVDASPLPSGSSAPNLGLAGLYTGPLDGCQSRPLWLDSPHQKLVQRERPGRQSPGQVPASSLVPESPLP